jgi:hypothetical protein
VIDGYESTGRQHDLEDGNLELYRPMNVELFRIYSIYNPEQRWTSYLYVMGLSEESRT